MPASGPSTFRGISIGVVYGPFGPFSAVDGSGRPERVLPPNHIYEATTQQHDWTQEVMNLDANPLRYNKNNDSYQLSRVQRYQPKGTFLYEYRSFNGGISSLQDNDRKDIWVRFVADPLPDMEDEFAATKKEGDQYFIDVWNQLDNPSRPPPYNTKAFFQETIVHEIGHCITFMLIENYGNWVIDELVSIFGGPWNTGPWVGQTIEAAAETFKDGVFPGRQFDNRTNLQIEDPAKWNRFWRLMQDYAYVAGPLIRLQDSQDPLDTSGYSGAHSTYPAPHVRYDPEEHNWDLPRRDGWSSSGQPPNKHDEGWSWGGNPNGASNGLNAVAQVPLTDYRKPPPPGSKIEVEFDYTVHVSPDDGRAIANLPLKDGFEVVTMASIAGIDGDWGIPAEDWVHTLNSNGSETGSPPPPWEKALVWLTGSEGASNYSGSKEVYGIAYFDIVQSGGRTDTTYHTYFVGFDMKYEPGTETWRRIIEVGLHASGLDPEVGTMIRGRYVIELTVPEHNGELALQWNYDDNPWQTFPNAIFPGWPLRSHPAMVSYYPPRTKAKYVYPQGELIARPASAGFVGPRKLIVGSMREAADVLRQEESDFVGEIVIQ